MWMLDQPSTSPIQRGNIIYCLSSFNQNHAAMYYIKSFYTMLLDDPFGSHLFSSTEKVEL